MIDPVEANIRKEVVVTDFKDKKTSRLTCVLNLSFRSNCCDPVGMVPRYSSEASVDSPAFKRKYSLTEKIQVQFLGTVPTPGAILIVNNSKNFIDGEYGNSFVVRPGRFSLFDVESIQDLFLQPRGDSADVEVVVFPA